jgi:hypothetical protein
MLLLRRSVVVSHLCHVHGECCPSRGLPSPISSSPERGDVVRASLSLAVGSMYVCKRRPQTSRRGRTKPRCLSSDCHDASQAPRRVAAAAEGTGYRGCTLQLGVELFQAPPGEIRVVFLFVCGLRTNLLLHEYSTHVCGFLRSALLATSGTATCSLARPRVHSLRTPHPSGHPSCQRVKGEPSSAWQKHRPTTVAWCHDVLVFLPMGVGSQDAQTEKGQVLPIFDTSQRRTQRSRRGGAQSGACLANEKPLLLLSA